VEGDSWVAAVAANWWAAETALERMTPRFRTADSADSAANDAAINRAMTFGDAHRLHEEGDDDLVTGGMPVQIRYDVAPALHATLETAAATARLQDGRLELWIGTQAPEAARQAVVAALGLEPVDVIVYPMPIGGSFDRRLEVSHAAQAALIARETGRRVLDAAVSSYGTAREMRLLDRIDRRRLEWLIIQYNANDVGENLVFRAQGNRQIARSREKFDDTSRRYQAKRAYYPGKYAYESLRFLTRDVTAWIAPPKPRGPAPTVAAETEASINVLLRATPLDWDRVRLVIVEITGENAPATLIGALRGRLADPALPVGLRQARLVDIGARLRPEHFHVLDDHPNARGHRAIADAVLAAMRSSP